MQPSTETPPRVKWLRFDNVKMWASMLIWLTPLAASALALAFLAAEVRRAPFRLNVNSTSLWFVVDSSTAEIAVDTVVWQLDKPVAVETSHSGTASLQTEQARRLSSVAPSLTSGSPVRLVIHPQSGNQLFITFTRGEVPRLTLESATQSVLVTVTGLDEKSGGSFEFEAQLPDGRTVIERTTAINAKIGGTSGSRIALVPFPTTTGRSTRVQVSEVGFGKQSEVLQTGVSQGALYFMDLPSLEIKIFRGTDLRIAGDQLVLEALAVTPEGLEVTISGMARSAAVNVGSLQKPQSLMPTRFDRAQRNPWLMGSIGALGLLISIFGLIFTAATIFRRFAQWIGADSPPKS